jgi:hypothetical protein
MATPIFFIIGRARSGTTLLKALLDAHPNVIVPVECAFLLNLYKKYGKKKNWDAGLLTTFGKDLLNEPAFNLLHIDQTRLEERLRNCAGKNTYANVCRQVYESCQSFYAKKEITLLGDKNPGYSLYIKQLLEIYPEAKFIHIIRDYRDNIVSMLRVDYEAHIVSSLAYRWKYYNIQIEKAKKKHPDIFFTVRYEDLVLNTAHYLKEICVFFGISYTEKMLSFQEKKDDFYAHYPKDVFLKYHKSIFDPIDSSKSGKWKEVLSARQIRIAETVAGGYGKKFGYENSSKTNFITRMCVLPGVCYGWLYFPWAAFTNVLPYKIKMGIIYFFAKIFNPYWRRYEKKESAWSPNRREQS